MWVVIFEILLSVSGLSRQHGQNKWFFPDTFAESTAEPLLWGVRAHAGGPASNLAPSLFCLTMPAEKTN